MGAQQNRRRTLLSGIFLGTLVLLCGVLAVLQFRWIGELSEAARLRLRGTLQAELLRLSQSVNSEMGAASAGLNLSGNPKDSEAAKHELVARYDQWKQSHSGQVFRRVGLAIPDKQTVQLFILNLDKGVLEPAEWPDEWKSRKQAALNRLFPGQGGGAPPPFSDDQANFRSDTDYNLETPIFAPLSADQQRGGRGDGGRGDGGRGDGGRGDGERGFGGRGFGGRGNGGRGDGGRGFGGREIAWLILDINPAYVRDTLIPDVVQRTLTPPGGALEYQVEIVTRTRPPAIIYRSDANQGSLAATADASYGLWEPQFFLNAGRSGRRGGDGPGPGRVSPDFGHWQINVRHRAGSLEAAVAQLRWHNVLTSAAVLLLIIGTAAALLHFTRRTQALAELQMDFVAGVSHELRTPLTVIHTAAYNLQGKLAHDPKHVEKYGALIQSESGRLNALVEQILSFATAEAGKAIQEREPMSVESVIDEALTASKAIIEGSQCVLERNVEPNLPMVVGDRVALRHALENLVINAVKYGLKDGNWIGVSASAIHSAAQHSVEIRVADHGPGIPREEQAKIFDPFFRGARAIEDQIRGTGLGLSLVKKIVEAHGGTIRIDSDAAKGTAFILRLPAAPPGKAV